jgi:hypothetical protein
MTDAERLSLAYVPRWSDVPSPAIETWIAAHGRLPTADDKAPGHTAMTAGSRKDAPMSIGQHWKRREQAPRPVKYGTGRREA